MLGNIKMFVKWFPYLIIVGLVIALSVTQCQKQKIVQEVETFDSTILIKQQLAVIQAQGAKQLQQIKQDSLKTSLALQALKIENKNLRKKIKELRPEVIRIADSIPVIEEWVNLSDSLDLIQTAEIDTMRAERLRIWKGFNAIVFNRDEQIQLLTELVNHKEVISQDLRKKLRKDRRKKTFFKVTTGIAATLVLYLAIQD